MILLDLAKKHGTVKVPLKTFSAESGITIMQIKIQRNGVDVDLTGKEVTAVFSTNPRLANGKETGALSVTGGIVQLPIYQNFIQGGDNYIQINIRISETLEQCPIMLWYVKPSLLVEALAAEGVDALTYYVALVTAAVGALADVRAACELSETNAGLSKIDAEEAASTAANVLSETLTAIGDTVCPLDPDGKIPIANVPATAIMEIHEIASESELVALTAQRGDLGEIIDYPSGIKTVVKTYQLLGTGDSNIAENWVVWGTSYAVQAGNATSAGTATNADKIDGKHVSALTQAAYDGLAVVDPDTLYWVTP